MSEFTKTPIQLLTKQQFDEVYNEVEVKYRDTTKYLTRDQLLWAALVTGQITDIKYNELI